MNNKTPKFNKALEKYFSELKLDEKGGQERICRFSKEKFYVRPEDIKFYKKIGVPLPTLSPHERARRKLSFFNIYNLFYGKSDKTGKTIITSYPSNTKLKIWEHELWNDFDFTELGVDYDPSKSFFEQYEDFQLSISRPNLFIRNSVNSDFTNNTDGVKNFYLVFDGKDSENSAYSIYVWNSKNVYHSYGAVKTDICYDCNLIENSYKIFFSELSNNCLDSYFLFDCNDCSNCFMSSNLRHKKYYFENQQLTKEEYEEKIKKINFGSRKEIEKLKKQFEELKKNSIHKANHNGNNINSSGNYNDHCKNVYSCFYSLESENMSYCIGGVKAKDSMDIVGGIGSELVYDTAGFGSNSLYNLKFSSGNDFSRNSEYCDFCKNCNNCFSCIGLKNKSFCIFNKQYDEEEYWKKVDEIKTKMLVDGEYGGFFPPKLSLVPYNISLATSYGGFEDLDIAKKYGYKIEDVETPNPDTTNEITIDEVPDDIKDTTDDILTKVILDKKNNKKFKYTKEELEFHRQYNLALPTEHYSTILARKRMEMGPIVFDIYTRKCSKCGQETQVTFPKDHPDAPKIIYCKKCYQKEVA